MPQRRLGIAGLVATLAVQTVASAPASAVDSLSLSPDVAVTLSGTPFADHEVAVDNLLGVVGPAVLGNLPENAELTAYALASGGQLFALDTTAELPGGLVVRPRDVVLYDGIGYSLAFDGGAAGVPENAAIDAVSVTTTGDLLLSFDVTTDLPGLVAADEDLVTWDGAAFSMAFDGSAQGVDESLDLDAADGRSGGVLALSFDVSGTIGGLDLDDEDASVLYPGGPTWFLLYDGSVAHPGLAAADLKLVALPEPGQLAMLASGLVLLVGLGRRRIRR